MEIWRIKEKARNLGEMDELLQISIYADWSGGNDLRTRSVLPTITNIFHMTNSIFLDWFIRSLTLINYYSLTPFICDPLLRYLLGTMSVYSISLPRLFYIAFTSFSFISFGIRSFTSTIYSAACSHLSSLGCIMQRLSSRSFIVALSIGRLLTDFRGQGRLLPNGPFVLVSLLMVQCV